MPSRVYPETVRNRWNYSCDRYARLGRPLTGPGPTSARTRAHAGGRRRAPDHGRLKPWHLVVLEDRQKRFAAAAAEAKRRRLPAMSDGAARCEREKIRRSPSISGRLRGARASQGAGDRAGDRRRRGGGESVPGGARFGIGVMWKTGAAAYIRTSRRWWVCGRDDHIVAIMHSARVK